MNEKSGRNLGDTFKTFCQILHTLGNSTAAQAAAIGTRNTDHSIELHINLYYLVEV